MNRNEIIYWRDKYDRDEDQYDTGLEEKLRKKFSTSECATKHDIEEIIGWKFQGRLKGRRNLNLARITDLDEWVIESITKLAFQVDGDRLKLKLLTAMDGVGLSVASVILAFHDPERYGVLDFHAWHGLFATDKKIFTEGDCLRFLEKLREKAAFVDLPCRDIEKAYFKRDLDGKS